MKVLPDGQSLCLTGEEAAVFVPGYLWGRFTLSLAAENDEAGQFQLLGLVVEVCLSDGGGSDTWARLVSGLEPHTLCLTLHLQLHSSLAAGVESLMLQLETLEVKPFSIRPGGVDNNRPVTPDTSTFCSLPLQTAVIPPPSPRLSAEESEVLSLVALNDVYTED